MGTKEPSMSIEQKMRRLRVTYQNHLAIYKTEMEDIWQSGRQDPRMPDNLMAIAHRLGGSGKAYGFAELSLLASELEVACYECRALSHQERTSAIADPLKTLLAALQRDSVVSTENNDEYQPNLSLVPQPHFQDIINILLVDDDHDFSAQLSETLSLHGYRVHYLDDINQLEDAILQYNPLALIVDMDFSGQRFAGANKVGIWRQKDGCPLPVIFISGFDSFELRLAAVRAAGNHFLKKPLDISKLISLLHAELNLAPIEPYRVMVVDDDKDLLGLYDSVLSNAGYSVSTADSAETAIALLEQKQPELLLIDVHMPNCSGIELGRIIRQHEEFATIPLLFMSSAADTDIQLACARLTNDEFVNKPIEPWRLLMIIKSRVTRGRLLRAKTGSLTASEVTINQDPLTGLPKLTKMRIAIDEALTARDSSLLFAVLKIDIRHFHTVNNLYGYYYGDQVLQLLAWELSQTIHSDDMLCRESGDEFLVLTKGHVSQVALEHYIHTLVRAVESTPSSETHHNVTLLADIGVALATPETTNADELLDHADEALFRAKKSSVADVCYYSHAMKSEEITKLVMTQAVKKALVCGEFVAAYQPIFAVNDGQIAGVEALARWRHSGNQVSGPGEFISIMEEQGIVSQLTEQMLKQALSQLARWQTKHPRLYMSVNLSAQDIQQPTFLTLLQSLITHYQLTPANIVLEITESLLLSDWQQANHVIQSLKALGVRLALDDFGTGYSSLSYLHRINAEKLKIDRSFVQHWSQTGDARLLHSMIKLGQTMNMSVIAEGVEKTKELDFLHQFGCDQYQGFLTAKPMFVEEIERDNWL